MAIFEWRKVNLLDLKVDQNNLKITESLGDAQVTCYASGRGQNIICDSLGRIHVFYRNWECISFKGHDMSINLCALSVQNNLLVTISGEEVNEVFKVWNLSSITKNYGAPCLRKVTTELLQKPTALAVTDNGQLMAIGYDLGSISLYRGDIGRDNTKMLKKFKCSTSAIVGIAFQVKDKTTNMFVCSDTCIVVYNVKSKDKEIKTVLDETYSPTRCCALQNYQEASNSEINFIVGRDDAIYCFNSDGRGPCYVLEGQKSIIEWSRSSLIIISKIPKITTNKQALSVIDIQDHIIIYNCNIDEVAAIFKEFGATYILTKNNELFCLCEKDLQSKLNILFKKKQYEVAVKIACRQQYDSEGLAGIYKQYGDHLYTKRDYEGAVEHYIKTIGYLEPSYVTRKFLDSKHTKYLTDYLLALHEKRQATPDHLTTLLLNCLTRLELKDELTEFLSKDRHPDIMFDLDVAINIYRKANVELALKLAKRNQKHEYCVSILIENMNAYDEALNYITTLQYKDAENILKKYGIILMKNSPDRTTDIIKKFCTDPNAPSNVIHLEGTNVHNIKTLNPEKFLKSFFRHPDKLIEFLEHIIQNTSARNTTIFNTLFEMYLRQYNANGIETKIKDTLLHLLQKYEGLYDINHILILCRMYNFVPGIVWIYELNKLYHLVLRYHLENRNYDELKKFCERNGPSEPSLWLQVLNGLKNDEKAPPDLLALVLNSINNSSVKSQSPLQILNYLVADGNNIKLSSVRDYFLHVFRKEGNLANQEKEKVNNLRKNLEQISENIENIRSKPVEFRNTICDACHQRLTMPVMYFLCKHAFHQDCLPEYSDSEKDCRICHEGYSQLKNTLKAQSESQNTPDAFHKMLCNSTEPFSEVSTYFGRGLFNKIVLICEEEEKSDQIATFYKPKNQQDFSSAISEAKLRLNEGNMKPIITNDSFSAPKAEARIRTEEAFKYNKITEIRESAVPMPRKKNTVKTDKISKNLTQAKSTNPFEEDNEEDGFNLNNKTSNPKSTNPFEIDQIEEEIQARSGRRNLKTIETYNNNLNPFA